MIIVAISVKCLVLIHKLACEDYLSMNQQDARQLCLILSHFLADIEANTPNMALIVEVKYSRNNGKVFS